jgi:serine/threonine-protein kinase
MTTQPRLVGGRYELGELIGYGGMAEVHRGRDLRLGRDVAIKVLRSDLARDPAFLARFRREAQAAAGLNHPSIVSVYDTGEDHGIDGTSQPFIVMEYVEGRTLRDILKVEGRMPVRRAMEIAADVCSALDFSHRNGIVHRDIKPANVMITQSGAVKVMDFGIARAVADNAATVTQTANVIGTAQYLSPEQARGESVDARSDVYSTGCLLYELVTGAPPFQGDSPVAVAYQHVRENPDPPSSRNSEVPAALDSIVMKALAKNQLNRYQSAAEMRTDLQRALANQPVAAEAVMTDAERTQFIARTPPPPVAAAAATDTEDPHRGRRLALIWTAIILALLVVIGVGAYLLLSLGRNNTVAEANVPALYGQTATQATNTLKAAGFVPVQGDDTNGPCDANHPEKKATVCTQDPVSDGSVKAKKGSSVTFHLFTPAQVIVPSVIGDQYSDAFNSLTTKGLKVSRKNVSNSAPEGQVIDQSQQAGSTVAKGSTVTLSVSTGKVQLISVVGEKLADAQLKLNQAGWPDVQVDPNPVITQQKSKDGTVQSQNPAAGTSFNQTTTTVTLKVYQYVAPTTSPPTSPTSPTSPTGTPTSPTGTPTGTSTTGATTTPPGGVVQGPPQP